MTEFKYKVHDLFNPTLRALHALGGSSSVSEIEDFVIEDMHLTDEEINYIHRGTSTKLSYRLRWARNYLKHIGLVENSSRGVWSLTPLGQKATKVNPTEVVKQVQEITKNKHSKTSVQNNSNDDDQKLKQNLTPLILKSHGKKKY